LKARFLILSERDEDVRFAEFLAFANDLTAVVIAGPELLAKALIEFPQSLVFWDAQDPVKSEAIATVLAKSAEPARIFAVTDDSANTYPHLAKFPVFGNHLLRRYEEPAPTLYARIAGASLRGAHLGLSRYFPEGAASRKITLTRSGQKTAAVDAIQNFFVKQSVNTRIAGLVAQAVDELIMNAIFDAPSLPNGMLIRRGTDRALDFELIEKEHVYIEVASADDYVGINVTDLFGSLKREILMKFLSRDYRGEDYIVREKDPGAGLGLRGIIQTGMSLLFVCEPEVRTEVMVFFSKEVTYKEFRTGFRFLTIVAP
jgi:hypothetical protein